MQEKRPALFYSRNPKDCSDLNINMVTKQLEECSSKRRQLHNPMNNNKQNRETHKLLLLNLKGINEVIILCRIKCTLTDCHFLSPPQPPPVALDSFFRDFSAGPSLTWQTETDRQRVGRVQFNIRNIKISKDHKSPPRTYFIVDVYCNNLINLRLCSWFSQNGQPSPSFTQV